MRALKYTVIVATLLHPVHTMAAPQAVGHRATCLAIAGPGVAAPYFLFTLNVAEKTGFPSGGYDYQSATPVDTDITFEQVVDLCEQNITKLCPKLGSLPVNTSVELFGPEVDGEAANYTIQCGQAAL